MGFDNKCWDLAEYFLLESRHPATDENKGDLAQTIQDAIENWAPPSIAERSAP